MRDSAGKLPKCLHLLALSQLVLGLGPFLHLLLEQLVRLAEGLRPVLELAVGAPQLQLCHSERSDHEHGQQQERADDQITRQPPVDWLPVHLEIDGPDPLTRRLHRRGDAKRARVGCGNCPLGRRNCLAAAIESGNRAPIPAIDANPTDLRVDPIGVDCLLGRRGIAEVERCRRTRSEHLRLDERKLLPRIAGHGLALQHDPDTGEKDQDRDTENREGRGPPAAKRLDPAHRCLTPSASARRRELIESPRWAAPASSMKKRTRPFAIVKWTRPRCPPLLASVTVRIGLRPRAANACPAGCALLPSIKATWQPSAPAADRSRLTVILRPSTVCAPAAWSSDRPNGSLPMTQSTNGSPGFGDAAAGQVT